MNMGSNAMACSGLACRSNTERAAAQHRSRVSVSSMAASRMVSGIRFCAVIAVSNGLLIFMGRSLLVDGWSGCRHRTGLDRPAILFPTAMQARAFLVGRARAGFSSLSRVAACRAGGGAFLCLCGCVHVGSVRRGRGLVHHHERGTL
jgi:hypothetical protein